MNGEIDNILNQNKSDILHNRLSAPRLLQRWIFIVK